ncbi:MAG TPA: MarR family winged helix-turn-helix transcriptional regulator [Gammaproteobacteria bacterium]
MQEDELIEEILATAEQIATASHPDGERVFRTDHRWRLLRAIERSHYCFSISDLARVLRIPRQRAHEVVTAAAKARDVKVLPNRDDRRILQVFLTGQGRTMLAASRLRRSTWTSVLLNGLGDRELRATIHILRVIRHRLLRDEKERRGRRRT